MAATCARCGAPVHWNLGRAWVHDMTGNWWCPDGGGRAVPVRDNVREVAPRLAMTPGYLRRLCADGRVEAAPVAEEAGSGWHIAEAEVERILTARAEIKAEMDNGLRGHGYDVWVDPDGYLFIDTEFC